MLEHGGRARSLDDAGLPAGWPFPDGPSDPTPLGHYLTIQADGGVIYALFGPTYASVSGITTTTTNTVAAAGSVSAAGMPTQGAITPLPNVACAIPALSTGAEGFFKLHKGNATAPNNGPAGTNSPSRFLALICAGAVTATARLRQGSI